MTKVELAKFIRDLRVNNYLNDYEMNNNLLEVEEMLKEEECDNCLREYDKGFEDAIEEVKKKIDCI